MADPSLADLYLSADTDLDFTFDDIYLPSDTEDFLNSLPLSSDPTSDLDPLLFSPFSDHISADDVADFLNSPDSSSQGSENFGNSYLTNDLANDTTGFVHVSSSDSASENPFKVSDCPSQNSGNSGNPGWPLSYVSNDLANDTVGFVHVPSSDSASENPFKVLDCPSHGSGNSGNPVSPLSYVSNDLIASPDSAPEVPSSRVSENHPSSGPASSHGSGNSVSPDSYVSNVLRDCVVDQKVKVEEVSNNSGSKRKKLGERSDLFYPRTFKFRKSNVSEGIDVNLDEDEKRVARLMRNRESAQLSRQRKKHYVEELEDKVRAMHSTIQDLNTRITYVMAENASLRQQANGAPPPGMYPPRMGYPWVPCPPYMVKTQGSQVPLVPIPRLKPQQPPMKAKRSESKRGESKTKKAASVSLLGLLFFMLIFGGLVPMVNLKFKEMNESVSGRLDFLNNRVFYDQRRGRVLTAVNGSDRDIGIEIGKDFVSKGHFGNGGANSSEPLVASLYVPRNDKLVKIDGNLIIHSVMASEKAMASTKESGVRRSEETSLAVARNNLPNIIPITGRNRHTYRGPAERQRALSGEKDKMMSSATDGKLQQWFREGLAGPMLSSGMCTEVFQFDISPTAGAIVPATVVNITSQTHHPKNITTKLVKGRNRRILHGAHVPLIGSKSNVTQKPAGIDPEKENFRGNDSLSSMVVSVLVDPREAGDGDGDGVMGPKSISRIFVVVLIDSVKYVTYSCMLPLIGSGAHLVTT